MDDYKSMPTHMTDFRYMILDVMLIQAKLNL